MKISRNFFKNTTIEVAKNLLGCVLIHETPHGKVSGVIVETEAYLHNDPASHSFNGQTKRNSPMFLDAGVAYVYFTYGMHFCFNVVTNKKGIGEAVLVRSVKPLEGIERMKKRRRVSDAKNLCNGPAKLVEAFGITKEMNGDSLISGKLRIELPREKGKLKIGSSRRIGITRGAEFKRRFFIKGNEYLSTKNLV